MIVYKNHDYEFSKKKYENRHLTLNGDPQVEESEGLSSSMSIFKSLIQIRAFGLGALIFHSQAVLA